jgi:hypothetical protein
MCLGGPNHCRVGRMGSQSFYCRLNVVLYWQMLMCVLDLYVDIAVAMRHDCRQVAAQSIMSCYPCTHAHKKKKKIALVIRGYRRNEEVRYTVRSYVTFYIPLEVA